MEQILFTLIIPSMPNIESCSFRIIDISATGVSSNRIRPMFAPTAICTAKLEAGLDWQCDLPNLTGGLCPVALEADRKIPVCTADMMYEAIALNNTSLEE